MGKTIIQQARGHGSLRYRANKKAHKISTNYPELNFSGKGKIIKLLNTRNYSAPVAKIKLENKTFYNLAAKGLIEGQEINICNESEIEKGDIMPLEKIPLGTPIFNIETFPGSNGKLVRTAGTCAKVIKKNTNSVTIELPSKQKKELDPKCRATIGILAATSIKEKPILKAGKMFYIKKARGGKVWPRTSAVKMNAVDHPFGSGRGKRIKSKIAKRNAPPGAKVGLLRPRRTGKRK